MKPNKFIITILFLINISFVASESIDSTTGPHIEVSLFSEQSSITVGKTYFIGVYFQPEEDWHTYWLNPGDSGEPPKINLTLPKGVSRGNIQWPVPKAIPVAHLINYGYNDNLLIIPLEISEDYSSDLLDITANISWLVCKEDCIPGKAQLNLSLPVSTVSSPSQYADLFALAREQHYPHRELAAKFELTESEVVVLVPELETNSEFELFPFDPNWIRHSAEVQLQQTSDGAIFVLERSELLWQIPEQMTWLLKSDNQTYSFTAVPSPAMSNTLNTDNPSNTSQEGKDYGIAIIFLMAFVGGLILNIMPCVLPIIAIKAIGLTEQDSKKRKSAGTLYGFGVLASFLLIWLIMLLLQQSGQSVGWGFQMQSPFFVYGLILLFFAIALALFGIIEIQLPGQNSGQKLTQSNKPYGSFFTGFLAVVVASPCTAPFMAVALGIGLQHPPLVGLGVFIALAIGFAMPLVLIHYLPGLARIIPPAGAWMVTFRQLMAFPILATVIWLVWVLQGLSTDFLVVLSLISILLIAFAAWAWAKQSRWWKIFAVATFACALYPFTLIEGNAANADVRSTTQPFSQERLTQLQKDYDTVFVNVTADWCITCKVNEQVALSNEEFKAYIKKNNIYYWTVDWTRRDDTIFEYLQSFDRNGVPLYVVYQREKEPKVLPQILTTKSIIENLKN